MRFSADYAERGEAAGPTRCSGSTEMIGIGATEGQQHTMILRDHLVQVVLKLAPFVAGYIRVNQVISFQPELHALCSQAIIIQILNWGWQPRARYQRIPWPKTAIR